MADENICTILQILSCYYTHFHSFWGERVITKNTVNWKFIWLLIVEIFSLYETGSEIIQLKLINFVWICLCLKIARIVHNSVDM